MPAQGHLHSEEVTSSSIHALSHQARWPLCRHHSLRSERGSRLPRDTGYLVEQEALYPDFEECARSVVLKREGFSKNLFG